MRRVTVASCAVLACFLAGCSGGTSSPSGKKFQGRDSQQWLERYKDIDEERRAEAGEALVAIADDYAIDGLIGTMKTDSCNDAAQTAFLLARFGSRAKKALPEIERLRKDPGCKGDLQGLIVAIGKIRGDFNPYTTATFLKVVQSHKDRDFRWAAALLLDCDVTHEATDTWQADCKKRLPALRAALAKEQDAGVRERLQKAVKYLESLP